MMYQGTIKDIKLMDYPGLNVTKYHQVLFPALNTAYQMNSLPLNVGLIVLKNHTGPKDLAYTSLLGQFFAYHKKTLTLLVSIWPCGRSLNSWATSIMIPRANGSSLKRMLAVISTSWRWMVVEKKESWRKKMLQMWLAWSFQKGMPSKEGIRWQLWW